MIEVERKFELTDAAEETVKRHGRFLGEKTMEDVYYDYPSIVITSQDKWLRKRNGGFDLKISAVDTNKGKTIHHYHEIEDLNEICRGLGIPLAGETPFEKHLQNLGIIPYAHLTTVRRSYDLDGVHIDCDWTDDVFTVMEAEIVVPTDADMPAAEEKIASILAQYGIDAKPKKGGKLISYIRNNRPDVEKILKDADVI